MPSINNSCVICDDVRHEKSGKSILIGTYNDVILCTKADWDGQDSKMALAQIYFANIISGAPSGPLEIVWWIESPGCINQIGFYIPIILVLTQLSELQIPYRI